MCGKLTKMRIELGHLPLPELNPNRKLHHMAKHHYIQQAQEEAMILAINAGIPLKPFKKAHISVTFIAKDKRKRDLDNLFASIKATIDGIVYAGVLEDDDADHVSYTIQFERGEADNTIIEIERR